MTSRARGGIGAWLCLSAALCLAVIVSSRSDSSELGAPVYWTWALTGLQVMLWRHCHERGVEGGDVSAIRSRRN